MRSDSPAMWYSPGKPARRTRPAIDRWSPSKPLLLLASMISLSSLPFIYFFFSTPASPESPTGLLAPLRFLRSALGGGRAASSTAPLKIITLAFNFTVEHKMIDHNCAILSRTRHVYEIHTDDVSRRYCKTCRCVPFKRTHCACAIPGKDNCGLCEKLHFLVRAVRANTEFLFLDSDLFIVRPDFVDLVRRRAADFDFLAMYDDWGGPCKQTYMTSFNTGLMFVRRLPGVDYDMLPRIMAALRTNDDQMTITRFVMRFYDRWDSLSLRWHCRFIWKKEKNIPPQHCYTFHDRANDGLRALNNFLSGINRSLLHTGPLPKQQLDQWFAARPADGVLRENSAVNLPGE